MVDGACKISPINQSINPKNGSLYSSSMDQYSSRFSITIRPTPMMRPRNAHISATVTAVHCLNLDLGLSCLLLESAQHNDSFRGRCLPPCHHRSYYSSLDGSFFLFTLIVPQARMALSLRCVNKSGLV